MPPNDNANYDRWAKWLADQARVLGEARMLRDDQELTPEIRDEIIKRFRAFLDRAGKSDAWAAKSLAMGAGTLSAVLAGTYTGDDEDKVRQIDKWTEQQILRELAPKPAGFVKTTVAGQIYGMAKWVQKIGAIGVVHGPAGIGKTITLEAIRAETPGAVMLRITTAGQSKLSVLEALARAARVGGYKLTSDRIFQQLVEVLRDTNRLIIVDEVHKLEGRRKDEALHTLRDLHDETRCPMLWAGMSNIADYIQLGKTRFEPLDQLASRIKFWLNLRDAAEGTDGGPGLFTVEDVRKWLGAQSVRLISDDAVRYLQMLANTVGLGGLRTCDGLVRIALAKFDGKQITAQMLRSLRVEQLGRHAAEAQEQQMQMRIASAG